MLQLTGAAVGAGVLAGCTGGEAGNSNGDDASGNGSGDSGGNTATFDGWFDDVSNYDGVTDATGESNVTVAVGAGSDGLRFDPAAVRVDAGTTVTWEWTGDGGSHNVITDGGEFQSDYYSEAGATFEYAFDGAGTYKYYCNPHKTMGMKGAVVVD